jgi:hypothetical protein
MKSQRFLSVILDVTKEVCGAKEVRKGCRREGEGESRERREVISFEGLQASAARPSSKGSMKAHAPECVEKMAWKEV